MIAVPFDKGHGVRVRTRCMFCV